MILRGLQSNCNVFFATCLSYLNTGILMHSNISNIVKEDVKIWNLLGIYLSHLCAHKNMLFFAKVIIHSFIYSESV